MSEQSKPRGRPFKPGESGNPGGRQKGVERMFRDMVAQSRCKHTFVEIVDGQEVKREIEVDGWEMARIRLMQIIQFGDDRESLAAIKFAHERAFGMAKQTVTLVDDVPADREIDWSQVPLERRRELLAALAEIEALTAPHVGTEH